MPEKLPRPTTAREKDAERVLKNAKRAAQQGAMVAREAARFLEKQPPEAQEAIKKILADLPEGVRIDPTAIDFASMKPGMGLAKMIQTATGSGQRILELWMRVLLGAVFLFLYAPIAVLIAFSFNDSKRNIVWQGFTLKYYAVAWNNADLFDAMTNSLIIAAVSTTSIRIRR